MTAVKLNFFILFTSKINILSLGYNVTKSADILGNNLIHLACKYGSKAMIDIICTPRKYKLDLEAENLYGFTAIMEGARNGNCESVKQLMIFGGNAKKGLEGKYCSWLLVLIFIDEKEKKKKSERGEKKVPTQTSSQPVEDIDKMANLNFQNLQKNKSFILNKFDINVLRRDIRLLIDNGKFY